jgi:hypothetical protein
MRANSTNTTQLEQTFFLSEGTGFASLVANDGTNLLYYQDDGLNLIEERYVYPKWTFQNPGNPNTSITGLYPGDASTIVALSYDFGGLPYRSLFFIDGSGNVCTSNTTNKLEETTVWSSVSRLSSVPAYTGSTAGLAACVDTNPQNWNGIMLYYGDTQSIIRAFGFDFTKPSQGWIDKTTAFGVAQVDTASGIGCTLGGSLNGQPAVNLYWRSLTTRSFQGYQTPKSAKAGSERQLSKQSYHLCLTRTHH